MPSTRVRLGAAVLLSFPLLFVGSPDVRAASVTFTDGEFGPGRLGGSARAVRKRRGARAARARDGRRHGRISADRPDAGRRGTGRAVAGGPLLHQHHGGLRPLGGGRDHLARLLRAGDLDRRSRRGDARCSGAAPGRPALLRAGAAEVRQRDRVDVQGTARPHRGRLPHRRVRRRAARLLGLGRRHRVRFLPRRVERRELAREHSLRRDRRLAHRREPDRATRAAGRDPGGSRDDEARLRGSDDGHDGVRSRDAPAAQRGGPGGRGGRPRRLRAQDGRPCPLLARRRTRLLRPRARSHRQPRRGLHHAVGHGARQPRGGASRRSRTARARPVWPGSTSPTSWTVPSTSTRRSAAAPAPST